MEKVEQLQEELKNAATVVTRVAAELDSCVKPRPAKAAIDFERLKLLGEKGAFRGHRLGKCVSKEAYLTLLLSCMTVGEAGEAGWTFLYRVACGGGYTADVHELLPAALTLTEAELVKLVKQIGLDGLEQAFVFDSLLLYLHGGAENQPTLEYLAGLYALLKVPEEEFADCLRLAQRIFAADQAGCEQALEEMAIVPSDSFCYLYEFSGEPVWDVEAGQNSDSDALTVFGAQIGAPEVLDLNAWTASRIVFVGCTFTRLAGIRCTTKEVQFRYCRFIGNRPQQKDGKQREMAIEMNAYLELEHASLDHCRVQDFQDEIPLLQLTEGKIDSCRFLDCNKRGDDEYAFVQSLLQLGNVEMMRSLFQGCNNSSGACL